jgi:hypothetical protein
MKRESGTSSAIFNRITRTHTFDETHGGRERQMYVCPAIVKIFKFLYITFFSTVF